MRYVGDFLVAEALAQAGKTSDLTDEEIQVLAEVVIEALDEADGEKRNREIAAILAKTERMMNLGNPANQSPRKPFHWLLEFPEVFLEGDTKGFDAIVGNPPFMHGSWISSRFGDDYAQHIREQAPSISGKVDYVIFFLKKASELIREQRSFGLILTAKANQGDARKSGFQILLDQEFSIFNARSDIPWVGSANVLVCIACLYKGRWKGKEFNSHLEEVNDESRAETNPFSLETNEGTVYLGAKPDALGFMLTLELAETFLDQEGYFSVIRPYYSGSDLNDLPELLPSRYIIDFSEYTLEQAECYPDLIEVLEKEVKPKRLTLKRKSYQERWWQFTEPQLALFRAIRRYPQTLAVGRVSKYFAFSFVPTNAVYSDKVVVFVRSSIYEFAILSSTIHSIWALEWGTTHGQGTPNYKPTECGRTFPFPTSDLSDLSTQFPTLNTIGETYYTHRQAVMRDRQEGLTKTYNRFHDANQTASDIQRLCELHIAMDQAVAIAYGWQDLDLGHGFHKTKQGDRFTISETAKREVLDRLLELNHQRYAEEVAQGLHDKGKKKGKGQKAKGKPTLDQGQLNLL